MEILFAILILILLYVGLVRRKKEEKTWKKAERYEESGDWLDKRASERGTYGSLDAEMENDRKKMRKQVKINELTQILLYSVSANGSVSTQSFIHATKKQASRFVDILEQLTDKKTAELPELPADYTPQPHQLKNQILDFSYKNYPTLLDLEIETLKRLDFLASELSATDWG